MRHQLKASLKDENVKYQLVPSYKHFKLNLERHVRTFNLDFSVRGWDELIPQADQTLNLPRAAQSNPTLSVCVYIFMQFDWNVTLLVPPCTRVLTHDKPAQQPTWARHRKNIGLKEYLKITTDALKCTFQIQELRDTWIISSLFKDNVYFKTKL